jgi:hypothetical protein
MSYLVANIPPIEVLIDKRFLYDFQRDKSGKLLGEGEWERGHWVTVKSVPNRALLFETYIDRFGAVYDKLPIHAFRWRVPEGTDTTLPLDFLQLWDCLSYNISVIQKRVLEGCKVNVALKDKTTINGEYLFTIDTCHSESNEIDSWWSNNPAEHKSYNICKLENGQFCAQPNNRVKWLQTSRKNDLSDVPYFRYSTRVWRAEPEFGWEPDDTNWNYDG